MNKRGSTYIIAEAGVNHNGSLPMAKKLIDCAVEAGVDAVKFQTFRAETLVSAVAPKAEYQKKTTSSSESQYAMLKKLELNETDHQTLLRYCKKQGIRFLSTPFDELSILFLANQMRVPFLKLPSGEITNAPLLLAAARTKKKIILSTGMSDLDEVREALGVLAFGYTDRTRQPSIARFRSSFRSRAGQKVLREKVTLLHCTTEYPAPFDEVNLRAIATLRDVFGLPVGLSDHTTGVSVSIAAVALGATVIEKHFTLDRNLPGPDHKASLTPKELRLLVQSIREVETALGTPEKVPTSSEWKNRRIARRSLVTLGDIVQGEKFTARNLGCKRPAKGTSPLLYWDVLGTRAQKNYKKDEILKL